MYTTADCHIVIDIMEYRSHTAALPHKQVVNKGWAILLFLYD